MEKLFKRIKDIFNEMTARPKPSTYFHAYLTKRFDEETAEKVYETLQQLGLPAPENQGEFVEGLVGALILLDQYGLVVRVELKNVSHFTFGGDRINDSPWVLPALATLDLGKVVLEICPGIHQSKKAEYNEYLRQQIERTGLSFWDYKFSNIGHIPVKTPNFPEGIPVVLDRLAVRRMAKEVAPVKAALDAIDREVLEAREKIYAPLRKIFNETRSSPRKMKIFWKYCARLKQQGQLVPGWNEPQPEAAVNEKCAYEDNKKTLKAAKAAGAYKRRFRKGIL